MVPTRKKPGCFSRVSLNSRSRQRYFYLRFCQVVFFFLAFSALDPNRILQPTHMKVLVKPSTAGTNTSAASFICAKLSSTDSNTEWCFTALSSIINPTRRTHTRDTKACPGHRQDTMTTSQPRFTNECGATRGVFIRSTAFIYHDTCVTVRVIYGTHDIIRNRGLVFHGAGIMILQICAELRSSNTYRNKPRENYRGRNT